MASGINPTANRGSRSSTSSCVDRVVVTQNLKSKVFISLFSYHRFVMTIAKISPYRAKNWPSQVAQDIDVVRCIKESIHRSMMEGCVFRLCHHSRVFSSKRVLCQKCSYSCKRLYDSYLRRVSGGLCGGSPSCLKYMVRSEAMID
jgi:hypothetical protein